MKKQLIGLGIAALMFGGVGSASAVIIDGGNVNGFDTFLDQNTGRIWMDMDSFFGLSTTEMITKAESAGFTFAAKLDVEELLNSLPLSSSEWDTIYKPFMGDAPNRELIWGAYDDGVASTNAGWAHATDYTTYWNITDDTVAYDFVPNANSASSDMNIWAYRSSSPTPTPEPATMLLFGTGLIGLVGSRLRKKKK